jgi:hypothetical protein
VQGSSIDLQPDSQFRYISHGMPTTLSHMDAILCTNCGFTLVNAQSTPISPVPGILRTNCFPTDNETVQIRRAVEEVESEVAQLEWETSRVQDILKKLESKHQELKRFQSDHLALLTPARRLIPEILSEIFIQCLPSFDSLCKRWSQTPINTPLCLGQICSGWRAVVFSTPKLWATFVVDHKSTDNHLLHHHMEQWFSRSAGYPLSLAIDLYNHERQIDAITRVSDRWSNVIFSMSLRNARRFADIKSHLSQLQNLHLELCDVHPPNPPLDIFEDAPCLRSLSINSIGISLPILHTNLKLPWSQLKRLELKRWGQENSVRTLQNCTNLVDFTYKPSADEEQDETSVLVDLPCLKIIDLCGNGDHSFGILDHLVVSALRDVTIRGWFSFKACRQFASLVQRSSCYVQKLHLRSFVMREYQLMICLEHIPTLVELDIEYSAITDKLILRFTHGRTKNLLLPKLQRLRICVVDFRSTPGLFVDMIQSRWGATDGPSGDEVAKLRVVSLQYCKMDARRASAAQRRDQVISHTADDNPVIGETDDDAMDATGSDTNKWSQLDPLWAKGLDFHVDRWAI